MPRSTAPGTGQAENTTKGRSGGKKARAPWTAALASSAGSGRVNTTALSNSTGDPASAKVARSVTSKRPPPDRASCSLRSTVAST